MPTTPTWKAAQTGLPPNVAATNHASQVDQFLGSHGITPTYDTGRFILPFGSPNLTWVNYGNVTDLDQPFTMPASGVGTGVVRLAVPLQATGNGADVLISLYPDNGAGQPDITNLLASSKIPASWTVNLGAPNGLQAAGPVATAANNILQATGGIQSQPWAGPTGDATGVAQNQSVTCSGNYLITAGGSTSSAIVPVVNTIPYLGGTSVGLGVPQPSLPIGTELGMLCATGTSLVFTGGLTGSVASPTPTANTWVANWNQSTGVVGSWSSQTALPTAIYGAGCAASSATNTVYVVGGTDGSSVQSAVYFASVTNGQITTWNAGPPLPVAAATCICAVVNGWLIVAGGNTSPSLSNAGATVLSTAYYSKINSDGSLTGWRRGPTLLAVAAYAPGWDLAITDSAIVIVGGRAGSGSQNNAVQTLAVTADGPAPRWELLTWREAGVEMVAAFSTGTPGQWLLVNTNIPASQYYYTTLIPVPYLSCPIAATLTLGATYHAVFQQVQTTSAADYVSFALIGGSPLSGPDALKSARHSGTWTSANGTGWAMPLSVHNNQPALGNLIATWEDPSVTGSTYTSNASSRISALVYDAGKGLLTGIAESTTLPTDALNSNPTFATSTSPWTAHNCTFVQSAAQTHGGFAFSGLLTPNGSSATVNVTSELVPIRAAYPSFSNAQWYQLNGWLYSPTGWSNVSLSVDWYDRNSTYITTSNTTTTLAAATWKNLVNTYQPPTNAAYAAINMIEGSTPAAGNTLYLSNVTIGLSPELAPVRSSVSQITYSTTGQPIGVTQLA